MFPHRSQVRPSLAPEQYPTYPVHHGGFYHPQSFRVHEVVGDYHHPQEILRPESAPVFAHRPQAFVHEMNEQRCLTGSPTLGISQTMIHYIPEKEFSPALCQRDIPSEFQSLSKIDLGRPPIAPPVNHVPSINACEWASSQSLSPVLTASSDASRVQHLSEDNLSWYDAEQYFHLVEGELSGGSTCGHSVDLSVSGASFGLDSTCTETVVSCSRSKPTPPRRTTSPNDLASEPAAQRKRSRRATEERSRPRSAATGRRCRTSNRAPKMDVQPDKLKELVKRRLVAQWAKKEQDSRTLQKMMRAADERDREFAWNEIERECIELSCHVFGNYVVQKFLEYGSRSLRTAIVSCLKGELKLMARDNFGCRVVQKAIEVSDVSGKKMLLDCLKDDLAALVACQHGNHVIQKFVIEVPAEHLEPIYNVFDGRVVGHCFQMYGCRVVQRLYVHATSEFKDRMTQDILDHCLHLARDPWGNYVIQFIVENGRNSVVKRIVDMLLEDFQTLSFDKLASNVVEKCVEFATSSSIDAFVKCLLMRSNQELVNFLTHDYGNYVVQTIVDRASFKHGAHKIHRRLKKYGLSQEVKMSTAGRRVMSKLEEKMHDYQKNRNRGEKFGDRRH